MVANILTYIGATLIGLSFLIHPFSWHKRMVDRVSASIVRVTGVYTDTEGPHETICTGFVITPEEVLTAAHCIFDDTKMKVDGAPAEVLKGDRFYDLALLHAATVKRPLTLDDAVPERFEVATAIGYGRGWTKLTVLEVKPFLINFSRSADQAPAIYMEGGLIPGMSGGPIVNSKGRVIAIGQQTNEGVGMGVGTLIMRAFLLGTD